MKKYISILISLSILAGLIGCEREMMDYEGTASLYFDVQRGAEHLDPTAWPRWYYTPVNFLKIQDDSVVVELKMAFSGNVVDYDRPFKIDIISDSTNVNEGTHFTLKRDWIMPAKATSTPIKITIYKNEEYMENPGRIMLRIVPSEYFDANMTFDKLAGRYDLYDEEKLYQPDPRVHNIILEYQVQKPNSWAGLDNPNGSKYNPLPHESGTWGAYTAKKYLLILEITGLQDKDFENMPFSQQDVVGEVMSRYLEAQFGKGEPILEEDGRLMWFSGVNNWISYQYEW